MKNLALVTEEIEKKYRGFKSYVLSAEQIAMTDEGILSTGKNKYQLTVEALDQLAEYSEIPKHFFISLEPDLQAMVFNRLFQNVTQKKRIVPKLRINLNNESKVVGFDNPELIHIRPSKLMDLLSASLPKSLSSEEIAVTKVNCDNNVIHISCISPQNVTEPQPGDVINGGIDILHHLSGQGGTQISCYLRRLICSNGAIMHICRDNKPLRVRKLRNGHFEETDMLKQIQDRLSQAWAQIGEKLAAIKTLTEKKRLQLEFLEHQRTRFSLNNSMLEAIRDAISQDELDPTGTQYDLFNAISRVATHYKKLTFRQQRTLSFLAGEFSQQDVHKCEKCGSWFTKLN